MRRSAVFEGRLARLEGKLCPVADDRAAALMTDAEAAEVERLAAKRRRTAAESTALFLALAPGRTRAERLMNRAWLDGLSVDDLQRLHTALSGEEFDLAEIDAVIRAHPADRDL